MEATDLQDIRDYWRKKYPHVSIMLYPSRDDGKFCGTMMTHNQNHYLKADTIGELISQGEIFLRKVK